MSKTVYEQQRDLEHEMLSLGVSRYRNQLAKAAEDGDLTSNKPVGSLLQQAIKPTADLIQAFVAEANSGKPGRRSTVVKLIEGVEPDVLAFITAKMILDGFAMRNKLMRIANGVGRSVELELWFRAFQDQKPALWNSITETMEAERVGSNLQRARMARATQKYEIQTVAWTVKQKGEVGLKLIELFIKATGYAETVTLQDTAKNRVAYLMPTAETMEWLNKAHDRAELQCPVLLPMLCPPRDWSSIRDGGYIMDWLSRRPMVKSRNSAYLQELSNIEMPAVFSAINALQHTAWKINGRILDVLRELWNSQSTLGGLPSVREEEIPPFPANSADKEAVNAWKRMARTIKEGVIKRRSKRIALDKTLWVADKFRGAASIYFPYFLDFRGRAYPRSLFLTPQGNDPAKALLMFAEGKELGEQGACWLAIHGANVFGYDKADLQARIDWVQEHETQIVASAENPLDFTWWAQADKPFQFLAFCFEWERYCHEGAAFKSHIPVALDGSCNGLQNFSMALRDEVGGAAVNLVPSDKPQDIYQRVADKVIEKLHHSGNLMAQQWLASGLVNRKLCKKPVMTLPYGAKEYAMRSWIVGFLQEQREEGATIPWDNDSLFDAAFFVGRLIWQSIGEVVVAARRVMDFLQETAKVAASEGLPIHWITPVGFPVLQEYKQQLGKRIRTRFNGVSSNFIMAIDGDKLDRRRQASGIAPNWVHSLDASHMMLTVNTCVAQGITDFAMVHDSYATHACNAELLGVCLRTAFVEQYREDVLAQFRERVVSQLSPKNRDKVPPLPPKGSLDPEAVLRSDFFFA